MQNSVTKIRFPLCAPFLVHCLSITKLQWIFNGDIFCSFSCSCTYFVLDADAYTYAVPVHMAVTKTDVDPAADLGANANIDFVADICEFVLLTTLIMLLIPILILILVIILIFS